MATISATLISKLNPTHGSSPSLSLPPSPSSSLSLSLSPSHAFKKKPKIKACFFFPKISLPPLRSSSPSPLSPLHSSPLSPLTPLSPTSQFHRILSLSSINSLSSSPSETKLVDPKCSPSLSPFPIFSPSAPPSPSLSFSPSPAPSLALSTFPSPSPSPPPLQSLTPSSSLPPSSPSSSSSPSSPPPSSPLPSPSSSSSLSFYPSSLPPTSDFVAMALSSQEKSIPPFEEGEEFKKMGDSTLLQTFSWTSHEIKTHGKKFYEYLAENAADFAEMGFSDVLLPPVTKSKDPQGFMPLDFYDLNSAYGTQLQLTELLEKLHANKLRVFGEIVLNRLGEKERETEDHIVWKGVGGTIDEEIDWGDWIKDTSVPNSKTSKTSKNPKNPKNPKNNESENKNWNDDDDSKSKNLNNNESKNKNLSLFEDRGEEFGGLAPIDHSDPSVQSDTKGWMMWLKKDIGFDGWFFDLAKLFDPTAVYIYCDVTSPLGAVGDVWNPMRYNGRVLEYDQDQHRQELVNWVKGTRGKAMVLDYTTKGILQQAIEKCEYWRLIDPKGRPPGVIGWWPSKAITFLENHRTGSSLQLWPFPTWGVLQGYAYILTHPGTPCVFLEHVYDWKLRDSIKNLVSSRKRNGIHSRSQIRILACHSDIYVAKIGDNVDTEEDFSGLLVKMGPSFDMRGTEPGPDFEICASGKDFCVWEKKSQR